MAEVATGSGAAPARARAGVLALRTAFWFLPACLLLAATALAALLLLLEGVAPDPSGPGLLYEGDATGAREILGIVAASMITVGTTVFSLTLVVLQLASSQFGPRVLTNFVSDHGVQLTMGTFVGVFWFSLLVLRQVDDGGGASPRLAVSAAVVLAGAAVVVLVWFIAHIVRGIQVMNLVELIARDLTGRVEALFPDLRSERDLRAAAETDVPELVGRGHGVRAESDGYVRLVDLATLVATARAQDLLVRLEVRPGDFVVESTPVMHGWRTDGSPARPDDATCHALASCLFTGPRPSQEQDVEFPARQLVEVAVRALAPANNDPVTAAACVHHLSAALCRAAAREMPPSVVGDDHGVPRLVIGEPVTFRRLVSVFFDQVRQNAVHHTYVHLQLIEALTRVVACSVDESRLGPLLDEGALVLERAEDSLTQEADRRVVREAYAALEEAVERARRERVAG